MKKHLFTLLYGLLLVAFTTYVALDTFVLVRVYKSADVAENSSVSEKGSVVDYSSVVEDGNTTDSDTVVEEDDDANNTRSRWSSDNNGSNGRQSSGNNGSNGNRSSRSGNEADEQASDAVATDRSYQDENISITITEYRRHGATVYVADVQINSPALLKTALAQGAYGRNVTAQTSETAEEVDAILAVNGDYYGSRERGYVVRNGVTYRTSSNGYEALAILEDGSFVIAEEGKTSVEKLVDMGAVQVFSFGPGLIEDGRIIVDEDDEVGKARSDNPRTAIGYIDEGHYVFVVSDGRTDESEGLTLLELAEFLQELGVTTGYNLDGGGSSTMVFMGEIVNNPTSGTGRSKERSVSDIVYIGY